MNLRGTSASFYKKVIKTIFLHYGFKISRIYPEQNLFTKIKNRLSRYYNETTDPYVNLYKEALNRTGSVDSFEKQARFYILYQMVNRIFTHGIPGHVAECGCFRGHSTYIIASLLKTQRFMNSFYIFDSFEHGLSDKRPEDRSETGNTSPEETLRQKVYFSSSCQEVSQLLAPFSFVKIYNGWIPDIFGHTGLKEEETFSLVHIDVDLYEPTKQSLQFFFSRMAPGGMILIDDYGYSQFPGAKKAVDEFLENKIVTMTIENHLGGYLIIV